MAARGGGFSSSSSFSNEPVGGGHQFHEAQVIVDVAVKVRSRGRRVDGFIH